jgi:glycosyltransferase involved in cell wall biosynthesis
VKVLHVLQTLHGGGAESIVRSLVPLLRRRAIDVEVATLYPSRVTAEDRLQMDCQIYDMQRRGHLDFVAPLHLFQTIRQIQPDIVHTHVFSGKYWGRGAALLAGVPIIVHTEHSPRAKLDFWEFPVSYFLGRKTHATITFSERTAAFIRARERAQRIKIIPNGVRVRPPPTPAERQAARSALDVGKDQVVIAVVANLYPQKNQQLAIKAFSRLPEAIRNKARLDFFGSGPELGALQTMAEQLNVQPVFHGFKPNIEELLPGVDIFLSVAYVEAAPMSFLEAMNAELPIVGTPSHGALDMIVNEKTGILLSGWDEVELTNALERSLVDRAWRRTAGMGSRELLEKRFDIEVVADKHVELYHELHQAATGRPLG